ncbi:lariat debranching enzyme [Nephila pilipes]|uniref:Lariat debranching enzyme n=1 Tax=Nephila pilipes TaxID=299642 RepID=A0A8X6PY08_NEPPI|nr:lariat debranching enzyme [Nephila pilipes]
MKIAVEGCAHGELDKIYEALHVLEKENNIKIDLLIICGDFQSVRNPSDLHCMAVPPKYRTMNTFYKYYSGEKIAPVLTIFIGGNHEASNYLSELSYGGWVCPNIYYMGYANVINVGGIRIAGLSGIYKARDYMRGHFECPPYDESSIKSAYHVRNLDVFRLKQVQKPIDVCLSHDWPTGVYHYGNKEELLRYKPFFREEIRTNKLGSQPAEELLEKLKPSYWFSAHLHCKFTAIVPHDDKNRPETKFLALDKCLPRRHFLQVLEINKKSDTVQIEYDPEWLSILRSTNHLLSTSRRNTYMPGQGSGDERWDFRPTEEEIQVVEKLFNGDFKVPENFCFTAPTYSPRETLASENSLNFYVNPQTENFCKILNITDPFACILNNSGESLTISDFSCSDLDVSYPSSPSVNIEEMDEDDVSINISEKEVDIEIEDDFHVDKVGSEHNILGSDDFIIDKKGSHFEAVESVDFFIDKIGSRKSVENATDFIAEKMKSPYRFTSSNDIVTDSMDSQPLCSTPVVGNKVINVFPELKEDNIDSNKHELDGANEPPIKRLFKRRNYDLYKSENDAYL